MATHQIPITGFSFRPDDSGKVWFEPGDVLMTNDVWDGLLGRIDENGANNTQLTTRVGFHGRFIVPMNYVGSAVIIPIWTATVTSGNVVWDFDYRAVGGDDAESLDQSGNQESVTVTDANPSAAWERNTPSLTLTAGNLAAGDIVQYFLARDGADANDTAASASLLFDLIFQYADA